MLQIVIQFIKNQDKKNPFRNMRKLIGKLSNYPII